MTGSLEVSRAPSRQSQAARRDRPDLNTQPADPVDLHHQRSIEHAPAVIELSLAYPWRIDSDASFFDHREPANSRPGDWQQQALREDEIIGERAVVLVGAKTSLDSNELIRSVAAMLARDSTLFAVRQIYRTFHCEFITDIQLKGELDPQARPETLAS